jgi:glycosyltransferase involved in cell wall biosynthesis
MDINLIAPLNHLGYGVVGYNILKGLANAGHGVAYFPIGDVRWAGDPHLKALVEGARQNATFYTPNAPCIRIWHQHELDMFVGSPRIGWPIFELNRFQPREAHHLKSVDKLFVCSQWAKDVVVKELGLTDVHVIPLGVDEKTFFYDKQEHEKRPHWTRSTTIFLNVGKWEIRKGHTELLEAFNKAFDPKDDVELWMINDNPFIRSETVDENEEWKRRYSNSKMGRNIKFLPRFEAHEHLRKVFHHVDCGVFPSHAEGWNLEIPELMACGVHIIATNYSGHTEFLTKDNAKLLDVAGMELAKDGKWFHGHGEWCTFSVDQLVEHMRSIHEMKQSGKLGLNEAGIETAKKFTWQNSIKKIEEALA